MLNLSSGVTIPAAGSATPVAVRRLQKDYAKLMQDPVEGITALPNEDNILEWHYCLKGSPDTPFDGGYYWGKVIFKENFPWSPPAITMITPNGRFSTNTRLCLSISDYHPESWNPGWTVSAILIGLHSFMNENQPAAGAIPGTPQEQKNLAAASKEFNCKYREFRRFFPQYVEEWTGVRPTPDEPDVAPVMLPAHATPSGIAVPSIANHVSRGAYAAAHHNQFNAIDAQFEEMLNAVRGAAGGGQPNRYNAPYPPFGYLGEQPAAAPPQLAAALQGPHNQPPLMPAPFPMGNYQNVAPLNYNEYMGIAQMQRGQPFPNAYGMAPQPGMPEEQRRVNLAGYPPRDPRNNGGGNNGGDGRRRNGPQNETDVEDRPPVAKRGRMGNEVITLD